MSKLVAVGGKVEARNRALTQDLQRERAERQRVQARLVAAERGAEGMSAENLSETVAALEVNVTTEQPLYVYSHDRGFCKIKWTDTAR